MKILSLRPFVAALLAGAAAPAMADTGAFPAEGTLPHSAIPSHYAIAVRPDAQRLTFTGTVAIDVTVPQQTDAIVLHAVGLTLDGARLIAADGHGIALTATPDGPNETVRLAAPAPIVPGSYRIESAYHGRIDTQADGLFALDYTGNDGKPARGLFTQFEPSYAREFAPMFDEPSYKATFDIAVTVPEAQLAVSNMPVANVTPAGPGLKTVSFQTSPRMSSYLVFLGAGDFERLSRKAEAPAANVEVGIVSPRGSGEQARFSLDELARLIPYYNDYFGQPYPLPKLDNVAGPGQSQFFGAMENWGAIFTFQHDLLIDPHGTSPERREYISVAQAHEVAHQWFGDLVTMAWWNDLWLNEGFASWMETKATDHFHPDWHSLLTRVAGREKAMELDAFHTTHPIIQPVRTVDEANQAFDAITYSKGEAVLTMLEAYAGEDTWRDGIRAYMAAHKLGNSHTPDLWAAVEGAGAKGLTTIADDFTRQPGIPLVRVGAVRCNAGRTTIDLVQDEFTRDRAGQPSNRRWHVPLSISNGTGAPLRTVLADGKATVSLDGCGPVVVNAGQQGYFRTLYTPTELAALAKAMPQLAPIDQLGVLADQVELGEAGYQSMAGALDVLAAVGGDAEPRVAIGALERWTTVYDQLEDKPAAQAALRGRIIATWAPRLAALGYDPRPGDTLPDALLRAQLIETLGHIGEPGVVQEARARFARTDSDRQAIDGDLREKWLGVITANADRAAWDRLQRLAETATTTNDRTDLYTALGGVRDVGLAQATLELALTDKPGKTTSAAIISKVAEHHPVEAFDFFVKHRETVLALLDASARTTYIERLAKKGDTRAMVDGLVAYRGTLDPITAKPVSRAIDAVRGRMTARTRVSAEAATWLAAGHTTN